MAGGDIHRSDWALVGCESAEPDFIRTALPVKVRPTQRGGRGRLQEVDIALELRAGEATAEADVHWTQIAGSHQGIHSCPPDTENLRGFLWRQQQRVVVKDVSKPPRLHHLALLTRRPPANIDGR